MTVKAFILFKVSSGSEREVCKKIVEFDGVVEASVIYGEYDLIVKASAKDLEQLEVLTEKIRTCLLYTSPSPRDRQKSRMPSSA